MSSDLLWMGAMQGDLVTDAQAAARSAQAEERAAKKAAKKADEEKTAALGLKERAERASDAAFQRLVEIEREIELRRRRRRSL